MKRCFSCSVSFDSLFSSCPKCGFSPIVMSGFDSYAPDFAYKGGGFKSSYFSDLASLEATNFWFQSRNKLILWMLQRYQSNFKSFLEIGCGTGYVLSGISKKFPKSSLFGSEIFITGLSFAAKRLPSTKFMQMDARSIPFESEFDVVGAFDVLEHIKEDEIVLSQIFTSLKPEGLMLITVPQHPWLWSPADVYACHERRYTASDLHQKIDAAGFNVLRSTSFITSLLPAMMISRFYQKTITDKKFNHTAELKISPWLNSICFWMIIAEIALIKLGFNFPFGGSRIILAKKKY